MPLLFLLNACDAIGPGLPAGAIRFDPPAVYQQWWNLTEQCSGMTGDLTAITWYQVPGSAEIPLRDGTMVDGRWDGVENRIILAGHTEFAGDLVRHEMLHALLRAGGHPRKFFVARCGGVVVCIKTCLSDAGPAPAADPNAQPISPSDLDVSVEVTPAEPRGDQNSGTFMMIITARNPRDAPVIAQLPPSGDADPPLSFRFDIAGPQGGESYDMRADTPEATRFGALESKKFIFDFHIGYGENEYDLAPDTYRFNGAYSTKWAPNPPTLTVSP